jgi:hypothetical protein
MRGEKPIAETGTAINAHTSAAPAQEARYGTFLFGL